jgi:hypothetical protein
MHIKTAALNVIFVYKMYILYVYANRLSCIPSYFVVNVGGFQSSGTDEFIVGFFR